ncbi:hypothetical protein Tco_0886962, partial [Tanacetum coccineum]
MLAIAAAGNDAAGGDDAANKDNVAANEAAGSSAEAHLVPHSPLVSPVRESTPERQPVSERPPSPSPTIPETEWVIPNLYSPDTDWRDHGPYVSWMILTSMIFRIMESKALGMINMLFLLEVVEDPPTTERGWRFHYKAAVPAGPSVAADKGKAPMPDLDIPAEFLAEDAQARKRLEEEQASERLVPTVTGEDLAKETCLMFLKTRAIGKGKRSARALEIDLRYRDTQWFNPEFLPTTMAGYAASNTAGGSFGAHQFTDLMSPLQQLMDFCGGLVFNEFSWNYEEEQIWYVTSSTDDEIVDPRSGREQAATKLLYLLERGGCLMFMDVEYCSCQSLNPDDLKNFGVHKIDMEFLSYRDNYDLNLLRHSPQLPSYCRACCCAGNIIQAGPGWFKAALSVLHLLYLEMLRSSITPFPWIKSLQYFVKVTACGTHDNVADLLTKAFDGPRFEYLVVHIGMVVNTIASCKFFLLDALFLLVVVNLPAGCFVSAGSTMLLLVVNLPAGCFVSAGSYRLC